MDFKKSVREPNCSYIPKNTFFEIHQLIHSTFYEIQDIASLLHQEIYTKREKKQNT